MSCGGCGGGNPLQIYIPTWLSMDSCRLQRVSLVTSLDSNWLPQKPYISKGPSFLKHQASLFYLHSLHDRMLIIWRSPASTLMISRPNFLQTTPHTTGKSLLITTLEPSPVIVTF